MIPLYTTKALAVLLLLSYPNLGADHLNSIIIIIIIIDVY